MDMHGFLCSLSNKRRALLEEDPSLVRDLAIARRSESIPGVLELGKTWHALDLILHGEEGGPLGDAILGRQGKAVGPPFPFGLPRLLDPEQVKATAAALAELPEGLVRARYAELAAHQVHGGFGSDPDDGADEAEADEEELEALERALHKVVAHYEEAAREGRGMLTAVV